MAWVARGSQFVRGGVIREDIKEGTPIAFDATISGAHQELPVFRKATSTDTRVFVAIMPPDPYPRPTDVALFKYIEYQTSDIANLADPIDTYTQYRIGPSLLKNPTLYSGWVIQAHRGGTYALQSGSYTYSDALKTPGTALVIDANNRWAAAGTETSSFGFVDEYKNGIVYAAINGDKRA